MNLFLIIISVLVSVICVLLALLQHYYFFYKIYKRSSIRHDAPVFDDFLPGDEALDSGFYPNEQEQLLLNSMYDLLESHPKSETPKVDTKTTDSEVHNTLQAAIAFKLSGKAHKALKLFEHAAAIAPANADVLNRYGEFLEQTHKDIVTADELYVKALAHSPNHEAALTNRERTAQVVDRLDFEMFKAIDEKRDYFKEVFTKDNYETVKKQAYYLHIYHTVGIEGNTMTVAQLKRLLETGQVILGKSIVEHNEVLGLQLAIRYVKILTRKSYITVGDILGIHRRVMGHVDPIKSGIYRNERVFVGKHVPPPPRDLPELMESYAEWLNSDEAQGMHPIRYAALAHYKLVDIHPFTDGNGRTSRLVMNLILIRAGYPPVMILKEQREKYYDALNAANLGDVRPFVRFIAQCTSQILDMYLYGVQLATLGEDSQETHEIINY